MDGVQALDYDAVHPPDLAFRHDSLEEGKREVEEEPGVFRKLVEYGMLLELVEVFYSDCVGGCGGCLEGF